MFRLLRLALLIAIAFVVGVIHERSRHQTACAETAGTWSDGLCQLQAPADG
ncbi:MAG: hypothetical protein OIF47_04325 [Marinibacterium sp.]|nr:hypothetical protein [Marinibacterium sp.]